MIDLAAITLQQVFQSLVVPASGISGAGAVVVIFKYFGKKLFKSEVESLIDDDYEETRKEKIENDLKEGILKELKKEMIEEIEEMIENHHIQCKHASMVDNDDRYLLRHEFKIFLENQGKTNERMEQAVSEIRKVCDQILFKLNS